MGFVMRHGRHARHGDRHRLVVMVAAFVLAAAGSAAVTAATATEKIAPPADDRSRAAVVASWVAPPPPADDRSRAAVVASSVAPASPEAASQELALSPSEPVMIDVPAIGVHSVLQQVGLTGEHTMEVPAGQHYNDAAWYKHSSTPGSRGPAVIVGHVDSAAQGPSVFFDLGDLRHGDEILVTRTDGLVAVFRVDEVGQYSKDRFPTALVYGDSDRAVLRLITCGGVFDGAAGHYLDNVVVFATLVGSQSQTGAS